MFGQLLVTLLAVACCSLLVSGQQKPVCNCAELQQCMQQVEQRKNQCASSQQCLSILGGNAQQVTACVSAVVQRMASIHSCIQNALGPNFAKRIPECAQQLNCYPDFAGNGFRQMKVRQRKADVTCAQQLGMGPADFQRDCECFQNAGVQVNCTRGPGPRMAPNQG